MESWGLRAAAVALACIGGAALQLQQHQLWTPAHYGILLAAGLALLLLGRAGRHARLLLLALALACIAYSVTGLRAGARMGQTLAPNLEGQDLVVTGVVTGLPRQMPDGVRFGFEIERATHAGKPIELPERISLGWYRGWDGDALIAAPFEALRAGQRWRLPVRLKAPHGLRNPHGFDFELWLFEQNIRATGDVRATDAAPARLLDASASDPVSRWRQKVRDAIALSVADPRAAGVLAALAVGDQGAIDRSDWELFRATGVAHLVSISGLHVTMFAWLAGSAIGALWRRSARAALWLPAVTAGRWAGVACATAYAVLAGWGVPAQRTVWMLAVAALLSSLGVRWPWPLVLLAAAVVVTAIDPWALLQPGFWLSFAAVGLLMASAPSQDRADDDPLLAASPAPGKGWQRLRSTLRSGVRTQVVATLGLAPLTLLFFQQVSLVGFVANLVAIPLVTLLITPLALLGALLPLLWQWGALCVGVLSWGLALLASWPAAVWHAGVAPVWAQAAGLLGALVLLLPVPWRVRALALPLIAPLLVPAIARPESGRMHVSVADVGQGSAVIVRTRTHLLLHDAGPQYARDSEAGTRVLLPLLRAQGERSIDMLMLSHRDADHVGGAAALMSALPVAALWSSLEAGHPLRNAGPPHTRCLAGQHWEWDGVQFSVLHPREEDYASANLKPNGLSCVLRVVDAAGHSLLLTGDIEAPQEQRLVELAPGLLASQVLVVPHHGSKTSSTPAFLGAVQPSHAIAQAGYRNRFGHPAPPVVARYGERGIPLSRSDTCGAWSWHTDARQDDPYCERDAAPRYWQHRPRARGAELAVR